MAYWLWAENTAAVQECSNQVLVTSTRPTGKTGFRSIKAIGHYYYDPLLFANPHPSPQQMPAVNIGDNRGRSKRLH